MTIPLTATYRLQMNAEFTFAQARERLEYLQRLGISHCYCSPILAARKGSRHGYDVVDPTRINPELGSESNLREFAGDLHERGMGLIVDIVPNHMGIGAENPYWDDVLARGERSRYARWFDIDWGMHAGHRRVVLPVLGDELDTLLERGELSVGVREGGDARVRYGDQSFPIDSASLPPELQLVQFDAEETGELTKLFSGAEGRERLRRLLDVQHYRLAFWRTGPDEINYRRFFDVNDLAALRMEDPAVFEETHALILRLVGDGVIDGLRVDHVDGLLDPAAYLRSLCHNVPTGTPLFVEKILTNGEQLRRDWPVRGTTGYEFLNDLEDAFIDPAGSADVERCYRRMRHLHDEAFADIAWAGKERVLTGSLRADVERLARLFAPLAGDASQRWTHGETIEALVAFMASMPVYRTYAAANEPVQAEDRAVIEQTLAEARRRKPERADILSLIARVMTGEAGNEPDRAPFVVRLQQVSGPAAAKGVEDNALYVYVPLASRNEVGGAPDRPLDDAVGRLHQANARRAQNWPLGLICTNTHDTKRSADVRARIDALSEMPQEWERTIRRWRKLNTRHRRVVNGRLAPGTNAEYLLYQTLVALWPPPRPGRRVDDLPDRAWRASVRERLNEYMLKAVREARLCTSWTDPAQEYEAALSSFIGGILEPSEDAPFLADVARLVWRAAPIGAANSLARVAVHLTSPGTPDLYQGDEVWNFALVDPDNRRPVNFELREASLAELPALEARLAGGEPLDLFDHRTKLLVTSRLLTLRRERAELFMAGEYRPLEVRGARAAHAIAFARMRGGEVCVTVAPRLIGCQLTQSAGSNESAADWWGDTHVELPAELHGRALRSAFSGVETKFSEQRIALSTALSTLPVAVYRG